ncbi:MAG: histidine kinase dimerization/phospho-acceptor domain-containing protein [Desulfobacteraceae bacterium]|jgi:signal transduction histidine kinase
MSCGWDFISEVGLQFFGKVTASISHEIKNALAIINENAGLLEDFALMAGKGKPIDPERLEILAEKITKQIRRADGIIKNMNTFAHSVDESVKRIDLGETLQIVALLSHRFASIRGVSLEPSPSPRPVMITTNPFFLKTLVWLCLDFAMDAAGENKCVGLMAEEAENGARIRITKLAGLKEVPLDTFPSEQQKAMLSALSAKLAADVEDGEIMITLSKNMDA